MDVAFYLEIEIEYRHFLQFIYSVLTNDVQSLYEYRYWLHYKLAVLYHRTHY